MNKSLRQIILPLIAAAIWGSAFVFQRQAATAEMPPFAFNAARSTIAFVFLAALLLVIRIIKRGNYVKKSKEQIKKLLLGGLCCGLCLTVASNLQQAGMEYTSAGKAGFLTALYIIIVPIFSIFLRRKVSATVWISAVIALVGLYCLSINESFSVSVGDVFVILCGVAFAIHILCIDYFTNFVNGIELSCLQFIVCAIVSTIISLATENPSFDVIHLNLQPILYVGVMSSGIAYTLQILAQKGTNPTVVSLVLSLESLFSVLSGALFLNEVLSIKEYIGCALMLVAVVLAQLPDKKQKIA